MEAIFLKLVNMSITASWLVLAVVLLRFILNNAPKTFRCFMWALVGLRLVCPFSFESVASLIPSAEVLPRDTVYSNSTIDPTLSEVFQFVGNNPVDYDIGIQNGSIVFTEYTAPDTNVINPLLIITTIASLIWVAGVISMLIYAFVSYMKIKHRVAEAIPHKDNIMVCDGIGSPFILGLINPKIYLPSDLSETELPYVLSHEQAHLKRHDNLWKPLGFALLTVYWFNPVMWIAYILLCRDVELACDEKVIKELGEDSKKEYSTALLNCSVPRKTIAACPLAFGETDIKGRIKSVLKYKKPTVITVCVAAVVCIAAAVCLMTDPMTETDKTTGNTTEVTGDLVSTTADPNDDVFIPIDYGLIYSADINSDGVKEDISVVETDKGIYRIDFKNKNGVTILTEEFFSNDQSSLHICNIDGKEYILFYNPFYYYKGYCNYQYEIYTFDEYSEKKVWYEDIAEEFDIVGNSKIPVNDLASFYEDINSYLEKSTLIISTLDGIDIGPAKSKGFYDCLYWLWNSDIDGIDKEKYSLRENLQKYSDYMLEHNNQNVENMVIYHGNFFSDIENETVSVIETHPNEYMIRVTDAEGNLVWSEDFSTYHVGYNSYLVCYVDNRTCLMRYNPYMSQGNCSFHYQIFDINYDGSTYIRYADSIAFDINGRDPIPVDELIDFTNDVDKYLENSVLLASTLDGDLMLGAKDATGFYDHYWWLFDDDYYRGVDREKYTLRENLQKYSDFVCERYRNSQ